MDSTQKALWQENSQVNEDTPMAERTSQSRSYSSSNEAYDHVRSSQQYPSVSLLFLL